MQPVLCRKASDVSTCALTNICALLVHRRNLTWKITIHRCPSKWWLTQDVSESGLGPVGSERQTSFFHGVQGTVMGKKMPVKPWGVKICTKVGVGGTGSGWSSKVDFHRLLWYSLLSIVVYLSAHFLGQIFKLKSVDQVIRIFLRLLTSCVPLFISACWMWGYHAMNFKWLPLENIFSVSKVENGFSLRF